MKTNHSKTSHFLEGKLKEVLQPVSPNPNFVHNLEKKLINPAAVLLEDQKDKKAIVLIGMGMFFGALLIWLVSRIRSSNGT